MSKEEIYVPSGVPTLDASEITYEFEKARIDGIFEKVTENS